MTESSTIRRAGHRAVGPPAFGRALAVALAFAAALPAAAPAQERGAPLRYVLAGETGAALRNIGDSKGLTVAEVERDTPLAVLEEKGTWLRVEPPGGYRAWIFGQYLASGGAADWYRVTGNSVLLRPLPESTNQSFPIDRVYQGDRVRVIERNDASKPLAEDWARVWSPPGTTAWVLAAETRALPEGSDGRAMWNTARDGALAARATSDVRAEPASAPVAGAAGTGSKDALAAYAEAEKLLEALPESASLEELAPVRAAYEGVLELAPDASTERLANNRLELLGLREELARIRAGLAENRARGEERRKEIEAEIAEANRRKDPLWGRFEARGWIVQQKGAEGEPVYLVRWAGSTDAQLVCTSGRYDLGQFVSYEVGIEGFRAPLEGGPAPARIDVRKLEVISARPPGLR